MDGDNGEGTDYGSAGRQGGGGQWGKKWDNCNSINNIKKIIKKLKLALAGVAQWIECWPANQRVTGLIPSQGTCLGCGSGS